MRTLVFIIALLIAAPSFAQPPNHFQVVLRLFATGLYDLRTHEGQGAFVDAVVSTLHAKDTRWGHLRKKPGQTAVHGHGEDAVLYLSDEPGQSQVIDFIVGAGGGPNPQPGWMVDAPRYSKTDWLDPTEHGVSKPCPVCPPTLVIPPYAGDEVFDQIGAVLFEDYAAAHHPPNLGMGRWFGRTVYDWIAGNTKTLQESIAKHRREWRDILGLP